MAMLVLCEAAPEKYAAAQKQMLREMMDSQRHDHCHEIAYPKTQEGKLHRILSAKRNIGARENDWIYDGRAEHVSNCIRYRQALVDKPANHRNYSAFAHREDQTHRSTQANSEEGVPGKKTHHHSGGQEFINDSRQQGASQNKRHPLEQNAQKCIGEIRETESKPGMFQDKQATTLDGGKFKSSTARLRACEPIVTPERAAGISNADKTPRRWERHRYS